MPSQARALFELTRLHWFPVGCDFMFWPFGWAFLSAAYRLTLPVDEVVKTTLFFALLGVLVHSAGCVLNDILDCDLDRKVERSQGRPIASGVVTRTKASILLTVLVAALFYLFSTCGTKAFTLGVIAFPICITTYPLMKRWMNWPSLFLGMTLRFIEKYPVLYCFKAFLLAGPSQEPIASCCWNCIYDTIYACQDKKDDKKAGVKSMAVHLGNAIRPVLTLLDATFFVCLLWAGYLNDQRLPFYTMSVFTPFFLCLWHIWSFDHDDPGDCWKKFTAGRQGGAMVCIGLIIDHYFKLSSHAG
ncbi:UbiA prenyltransferase family-domain-containing protein [Suillus bovinus]|uniref:UbiA prenyltransferase family-domain-containing protein n=1 Tax=Suillus bovinus TaxID=48563 RepID=UPI001B8828C1|nr:UbiA prenyltransferase family-domain-containing protein [Suillus bovinus]KAG2129858.1 UbiA prenyltransferase family-domain-containing protein [Suillus bovinus]